MVKAIFWFNQEKFESETGTRVDWRISEQVSVLAFYAAVLQIGFALVGVAPIAFVFINQFKND